LFAGVDASLLKPPVNVLRLALHPSGMAPRTANLGEWRAHLLVRLSHQIQVTGDPALIRLLRELRDYPAPEDASGVGDTSVALDIDWSGGLDSEGMPG
jgi:hypothetical protein